MKKNLFIKRFVIEELFGLYNVDIPFTDNINIFVGENGTGKTTILNALNYIIQGDSESLSTIDFKRIIVTLGNGNELSIIHDDLLNFSLSLHSNNSFTRYLQDEDFSPIIRRVMLEILKEKPHKVLNDRITKERIFEKILSRYRHDIPSFILERIYNSILQDDEIVNDLKNSWEYKIYDYMKKWGNIIYLPTYRRIEEDFKSYIDNVPDREYYKKDKKKRNFSYLQFGMDDVQESIDYACNTLKNNTNEGFKEMTSNLLTNFVNIYEKNGKIDFNYKNINASTLEIVFSRLADKINKNVKNKIIKMIDEKTDIEDNYHQYLIAIIYELNNIYEKNKQIDDNIENFKNVCNKYLVNKQIIYDKFKIECKVEQKNTKQTIVLKNLSSGEKQILSVFSKLYLNSLEKKVILFDEPELSLSILWQKQIVPDIINSNRCSFIAIITHSPFIFDNDYLERAIDIREYISSVK